jgi:hypothetical protein
MALNGTGIEFGKSARVLLCAISRATTISVDFIVLGQRCGVQVFGKKVGHTTDTPPRNGHVCASRTKRRETTPRGQLSPGKLVAGSLVRREDQCTLCEVGPTRTPSPATLRPLSRSHHHRLVRPQRD